MPEFSPGDRFGLVGPHRELILDASSAQVVNEIRAEIRRLSNLVGVPPVSVSEDGSGRRVRLDVIEPIVAKLSGTAGPYSFVEQTWTGSAWADLPGGRTGNNAYECNGRTGLGGKVYRLRHTLVDDWRFQDVRLGTAATGSTYTHTVFGCNGISIPANVDMVLGGSTVASGTTSGQVNSITKTANGTGYVNGIGYPLAFSGGGGSGAAGSFNVVFGNISGFNISSGGSGYTSPPTVSFASAGGTGGTATVGLINRITFNVPSTGSYTFNATETLTGRFQTGTHTQTLTLPTTASGNTTLLPATAYVCFQCTGQTACAYPVKKVLNFTVPGGSGTATYTGSNWQFPVTLTGVPVCDTQPVPSTGSVTFTHVILNGAGLTCFDVITSGICSAPGGTGCAQASDSYAGTKSGSTSGCTSSTGFALTCPGPSSIFTLSFTNFTYYSRADLTTTYFSGPITVSE